MDAFPIRTPEEFLAHALAIEHEAADRYREFERYFSDRGEEVLAGLCRNLARFEQEHYEQLLEQSRGRSLPAIDDRHYHWLGDGSPEAPAREFFYRVANARQLLEVALQAEHNAADFFRWAASSAPDEAVRRMAGEMALEENEHVSWVTQALEYAPDNKVDIEELVAGGMFPGALQDAAERRRRGR
jgi:rubrerythrin